MSLLEHNVSLKDYATLKVGGQAELFVSVTSEAELIEVIKKAKADSVPFRVIGGGSNILVPDTGLPGLTIRNLIPGWSEINKDDVVEVTIGAGEVFDQVVEYAVSKEYWGLENLSHIPGSMGATPVQNVGAYGVEIKDLIVTVRVLNTDTMEIETLDNATCAFQYRHSLFKTEAGKHYIITAVTVVLSTEAKPVLSYRDLKERFSDVQTPPLIVDVREAIIEIRSKKFPDWKRVGTAGSFFKNPIVRRVTYEKLRGDYPGMPGFDIDDSGVKIPLGWILENVCGLRGVREGNVGTYEGQALVLINHGNATATEVTTFAESIAEEVFAKTGLQIEWEVTKLQ